MTGTVVEAAQLPATPARQGRKLPAPAGLRIWLVARPPPAAEERRSLAALAARKRPMTPCLLARPKRLAQAAVAGAGNTRLLQLEWLKPVQAPRAAQGFRALASLRARSRHFS